MALRRSPQTVQLLAELLTGPQEWRYGYDLSRNTGLKSGTLYPILMRLAEHGLLETSWETVEAGRPPRHLYKLTGDGLRCAREHAAEAPARGFAGPAKTGVERGERLMTLLRRVAVRISNGVVRRASPGAKEWAQATAREMEFVENDWSALWWALGSVQVLFDRREAPIRSLAEVPAEAQRSWGQLRRGVWFGCFFYGGLGLSYALRGVGAVKPAERLGCLLVVLSAAYFIAINLWRWREQAMRLREAEPSPMRTAAGEGENGADALLDDVASAVSYRAELERLRDYYSNGQWRIHLLALALLPAGMVSAEPGGISAHPIYAGVLFALFVLGLAGGKTITQWRARKFQWQIGELDALLGAEASQ